MKKLSVLLLILLSLAVKSSHAQVYQWCVTMESLISGETNDHPSAYLWIPPGCKRVKGVVVGQHNMLEEGIMSHPVFRRALSDLGFAEVWITPSFDMVFNFNKTAGADFDLMMKKLAFVSGYNELEFAPIVPIGHSAAASYPWNFAAFDPGRTLALLSIHGDAPLTSLTGSGRPNPDWGDRRINGIPALMVMGEYEWGEKRLDPALKFEKNNPKATIAFLADAGHGHFDYSDELVDFLCLFLKKAGRYRLPAVFPLNGPVKLKQLDPRKGWLVDRWRLDDPLRAPSEPFDQYKGDKDQAFWAFDEQMAKATERYYNKTRAKKHQYINYVQQDKLLPGEGFAGNKVRFIPHADGVTFNVSAAFKDSATGHLFSDLHARGRIKITRICGPVIKINDTTFRVSFDRLGFDNPKRSGDIWLMASHPGDDIYRSAVQQTNLKIPIRNDSGADQQISFPAISSQRTGARDIRLGAVTSSGEKVNYYVKEGPAEIDGDLLKFTKIPPRARFPVKITVVAWQWGRSVEPKLKSAEPVIRSFDIVSRSTPQ